MRNANAIAQSRAQPVTRQKNAVQNHGQIHKLPRACECKSDQLPRADRYHSAPGAQPDSADRPNSGPLCHVLDIKIR